MNVELCGVVCLYQLYTVVTTGFKKLSYLRILSERLEKYIVAHIQDGRKYVERQYWNKM